MNVLFLSHLGGAAFAGPTYSVPKQIEAQSKLDNIFWYNATISAIEKWKEFPFYHDLSEYPEESIYSLPEPFNHPDVVVVECFYNMTGSRFRKELVSGSIPYIIIPRGELTKQAQNRKRLKKSVANLLFCKRFAKKAAAIQYLTEQEYKDSGDQWNKNHFVIPNGIDLPERTKTEFHTDGIKCVSIGRIEPYQKGLDLLIEACSLIKEELTKANCTITICGPDREGKVAVLQKLVAEKGLQAIISFRDAIYGKEKEELLLDSDVFLMPSRFEGHPMALIEALSYGLPCVVTTGSNMRQEVEQYNAGWTADNSADSIRSALEQVLLSSCETLRRKREEACRLASCYSQGGLAERTHNSFLTITDSIVVGEKL